MNHTACRCGWVSDLAGERGPIVQLRLHARIAHGTVPGVRYAPGETRLATDCPDCGYATYGGTGGRYCTNPGCSWSTRRKAS